MQGWRFETGPWPDRAKSSLLVLTPNCANPCQMTSGNPFPLRASPRRFSLPNLHSNTRTLGFLFYLLPSTEPPRLCPALPLSILELQHQCLADSCARRSIVSIQPWEPTKDKHTRARAICSTMAALPCVCVSSINANSSADNY